MAPRTTPSSPAGAPKTVRKPPDEASLREAALTHLGRYATSEAGLLRVLDRRIERWAREQAGDAGETTASVVSAAQRSARKLVQSLVAAGAINDAAFATQRAGSLARSGRSRRAVDAHLRARGVDPSLIADDVPELQGEELPAALIYARRRHLGAFRADEGGDDVQRRDLAALARAGFAAAIAWRALRTEREEALDIIARFRRGEPML